MTKKQRQKKKKKTINRRDVRSLLFDYIINNNKRKYIYK